jgi:hypothetical protein
MSTRICIVVSGLEHLHGLGRSGRQDAADKVVHISAVPTQFPNARRDEWLKN